MNKLPPIAMLTFIWMVLWESYDVRSLLGGLVVASLLVVAVPGQPGRGLDAFRPLAATRFLLLFAWQVAKANSIVAWEVVTPGDQVNEGIVAVPVTGASDLVVTVLANVISLTPGTLIVDVDRHPSATILYVHVLHLRSLEQARLDVFRLERALVRAIGSTACLADVEQRIVDLRADHPELDRPHGGR